MTDKQRMDWMHANRLIMSMVWRYVDGWYTLRKAVDFASKQRIFNDGVMRAEAERVRKSAQQKVNSLAIGRTDQRKVKRWKS